MQEALKKIIENRPTDPDNPSSVKWINAFIFVYNSAEPETFTKLLKIIQSVHEMEESLDQIFQASLREVFFVSLALGHEDDPNARVKKYVIGTKKDLKQQKKLLTVEDMQKLAEFNHYDTIRLQEVSALTAYGIQEVFSSIIDEVVGAGAPGMTDAPGADRPGMESEEEEDSDEEEEDVSEEETKQEPDADGEEQTRAPKIAAPD